MFVIVVKFEADQSRILVLVKYSLRSILYNCDAYTNNNITKSQINLNQTTY